MPKEMRHLLSILFILTSCVNGTIEPSIDNYSLQEIGQKLKGHWRLTLTETKDGQLRTDFDPDKFEYYEFEGLKGFNWEVTDNHDGSFGIPTCQPVCKLKEQGVKKSIEFIGLFDFWELEIVKLTDRELVLTDDETTWTYEREQIENW